MFTYRRIGRPLEAHNATSPEHYVGLVLQHFRALAAARPFLIWPEPHPVDAPMQSPQIRQGAWKVGCACGEFPSYDPEWQMAACFNCGAVYRDVVPPQDWETVEAVLMARPDYHTRNWVRVNGVMETVDALRAENEAHDCGGVVQ